MMSHPFQLTESWRIVVVSVNVLCCGAVSAFLLRRQINVTRIMPSQEDGEDTDVDQEMNTLLLKIKENEIRKASGEKDAQADA